MNIGEKIKELRKKNGLTQEKLADCLCVSYQAVSKWENGAASPDLSLIAPLTRILHVTADELLGIGEAEPDARYEELKKEYNLTYATEDSKRRQEICEIAVKEYPGDMKWLCNLAWVISNRSFEHEDQDEYVAEQEKAAKLFNAVIKNTGNDDIRGQAIIGITQILCWRGRTDEARRYAELLPEKQSVTREDVIEYTLEGDELLRFKQKRLKLTFGKMIAYLSLMGDDYYSDLICKLIQTMIPDGNYLLFHGDIFCKETKLLRKAMKEDDTDKAFSLLADMRYHAKELDKIEYDAPGVYKYTVSHLRLTQEDTREWMGNQSERWIDRFKDILNEKDFDAFREDERFKALAK